MKRIYITKEIDEVVRLASDNDCDTALLIAALLNYAGFYGIEREKVLRDAARWESVIAKAFRENRIPVAGKEKWALDLEDVEAEELEAERDAADEYAIQQVRL